MATEKGTVGWHIVLLFSFVAVFGSGIRDPGWTKIRIWNPGKTSQIRNTGYRYLNSAIWLWEEQPGYFRKLRNNFLSLNTWILWCVGYPGPKSCRPLIRYPGWKKHGSGMDIPNPQYCRLAYQEVTKFLRKKVFRSRSNPDPGFWWPKIYKNWQVKNRISLQPSKREHPALQKHEIS